MTTQPGPTVYESKVMMNDELKTALEALAAKIELVVIKAIRMHEEKKHKSISLGNLITIIMLLGVGVAAFVANT